MPLTLVTPPAAEPILLAEGKSHLRATSNGEDTLITSQLLAARIMAEDYTGQAFITRTYDWTLDKFSDVLLVPRAPLVSVSSIKYNDTAGVEQTLAASEYTVDVKSRPGRIVPAYGLSWPSTRGHVNDVTVRFVAGFGDAGSNVPAPIKAAMLLILGELYARRESSVQGTIISEIPMNARYLLDMYKMQYRTED